jgi:hypothetical protein
MRQWGGWMLVGVLALTGCGRPQPPADPLTSGGEARGAVTPSPENQWLLEGTNDERFAKVARHLRGFDVAMVEVGYRYGEVYWAGQDENWDYAVYQLQKIRTAIDNGLERRPKRAASATLVDLPLKVLQGAASAHDRAAFNQHFATLTTACNGCHAAEKVPFVHVAAPGVRHSPVGAAPPMTASETSRK